jgi:hypothetical protein
MDETTTRKAGALWAIGQGLVTALVPSLAARLTRRLLAKNYENAETLEPKPAYLRQVRAMGVGLVAAGVAGLLLEPDAETDAEDADPVDVE